MSMHVTDLVICFGAVLVGLGIMFFGSHKNDRG